MWKKNMFGGLWGRMTSAGLFGFVAVAFASACASQAPVTKPARTAESFCASPAPQEIEVKLVLVNPGEGRKLRVDTAPPPQSLPNHGAAVGGEIK